MKKTFHSLCVIAMTAASGCALVQPAQEADTAATAETTQSGQVRPQARPARLGATRTPVPPTGANTAATLDTTSKAERVAAAAPPTQVERRLGNTIASLGAPTEPGFWLKTPLVDREQPGRVLYSANGKSAQVTLIPIEGPPSAGSRMSLAAFRLLEAPLTDLAEIEVFAGG